MISKKIEKAFNDQINAELYSEYLYLAMSAYCETIDLPGFAAWMKQQAAEEHIHAMRFYDFVFDRDGRVELEAIAKPQAEYKSILDMFENVLKHEQHVTKLIHDLYALALKENDYAAQVELQWFIAEQVEEEKTAKDIIQQLKWVGDKSTALYMLDQKLAARPAPTTAEAE
ncbi:MAG: ferritin [Calditrichaceae bacterium]|nr:ferritin [Calditrichaceae bacterium]